MDWGLGSPNKTAALIAMSMIAVWLLAFIWRRGGFWIALSLFVPLGACLMHTFSRGGVLAALCGLGAVLACQWFEKRTMPNGRILAVLLAMLVIVSSAVFLNAHTRFSQSAQQDRSISNRLEIWREVPTMLYDAPRGWGGSSASRAFMEWYQALDFTEVYGSLVNNHLTWLVEMGWMGRFLYLSGWLLALVLCRPVREAPWMSICLGVLVAFFVAMTFSYMTRNVSLWALPVCALLAAIVARIYYRKWDLKMWWIAPAGAAAILAIFVASAHSSPIHKGKGYVIFNRSGGEVSWWVLPDARVTGSMPGRVLRGSDEMCGIAIAESFDTLPHKRNGIKLAVAGNAVHQLVDKDLSQLEMLVLLNPEISPAEIFSLPANVKIYVGEYTSHPRTNATLVEGASVFLSNWPALLP